MTISWTTSINSVIAENQFESINKAASNMEINIDSLGLNRISAI